MKTITGIAALVALLALPAVARERARDIGVPFDGEPGTLNAITDVSGVEVGYSTIIRAADVRTGVTAVLPRGGRDGRAVMAGVFALNGNGEMTGTHWVDESGLLAGPICITNTVSVGTVRNAAIKWSLQRFASTWKRFDDSLYYSLPLVAETADFRLSDINGFHVSEEDALSALNGAHGGAVAEGNVGGGTGMVAFRFKAGAGTASRVVTIGGQRYSLGALVQANFGLREELMIAGVPVGREMPLTESEARSGGGRRPENGSLIAVVATDAPLLPHQLKRLAARVALGMARTGGVSGNSSGDLFVAFSTANPDADGPSEAPVALKALTNQAMDPLITATVQATEEAIVNALVAAQSMTGYKGKSFPAIDHNRLREILRRYHRLKSPTPRTQGVRTEDSIRPSAAHTGQRLSQNAGFE